jgi:hypothetical protein
VVGTNVCGELGYLPNFIYFFGWLDTNVVSLTPGDVTLGQLGCRLNNVNRDSSFKYRITSPYLTNTGTILLVKIGGLPEALCCFGINIS